MFKKKIDTEKQLLTILKRKAIKQEAKMNIINCGAHFYTYLDVHVSFWLFSQITGDTIEKRQVSIELINVSRYFQRKQIFIRLNYEVYGVTNATVMPNSY